MLDLYHPLDGRVFREDERFHLQAGQPYCRTFGLDDRLYRRVRWYNLSLPDGTGGKFTSYIVLWFFRWYRGTVKCDGTQTFAYWRGQLGEPYDTEHYVMTTTPKEMFSVRLRWRKPDREVWSNQGGI